MARAQATIGASIIFPSMENAPCLASALDGAGERQIYAVPADMDIARTGRIGGRAYALFDVPRVAEDGSVRPQHGEYGFEQGQVDHLPS
jgi:hypothetical protein